MAVMITCPGCGEQSSDDVLKCWRCGLRRGEKPPVTLASIKAAGGAAAYEKAASSGANSPSSASISTNSPMSAWTRCFQRYATFSGRAGKAEYRWWLATRYAIFFLLVITMNPIMWDVVGIIALLTLLPSMAVAARRLHDAGLSAWNLCWFWIPEGLASGLQWGGMLTHIPLNPATTQLLGMVVLLGALVLGVLIRRKGDPGANAYGEPDPLP